MKSILILLLGLSVTYDKDIKPLFDKKCSKCHNQYSGYPDWGNYDVAYRYRYKIKKRVVAERDMPIGDKLSEEEVSLIKRWVDQGGKK